MARNRHSSSHTNRGDSSVRGSQSQVPRHMPRNTVMSEAPMDYDEYAPNFALTSIPHPYKDRHQVASWVNNTKKFSPDSSGLYYGQSGLIPQFGYDNEDDALDLMIASSNGMGLDASYDAFAPNEMMYGATANFQELSMNAQTLNPQSFEHRNSFCGDYEQAIYPTEPMEYDMSNPENLSPGLTSVTTASTAPGLDDFFMPPSFVQSGPMTGLLPTSVIRHEVQECEPLGETKLQMWRRPTMQPRPIRSASEKKEYQDAPSSESSNSSPEDSSESSKPRNDPRYELGPGEDGLYRCPFSEKENCLHQPTPQKCIYAKNLDSHLRPYRCKVQKPECQEKVFSSNACLFRHEREAHGLHGHGDNPYPCIYPGCERGKLGNGFPRKWNLNDHMKRVHQHPGDDTIVTRGDHDSRRQRRSAASTSVPMRRSTSSQAKAKVASAPYSRDLGPVRNVTRHHAPQAVYSAPYYSSAYPATVDPAHYPQVSYAQQSRHAPMSYRQPMY